MRTRKLSEHRYAKCAYFVDTFFTKECGYETEEGMLSYNTKIIIIRYDRVIYTGEYSVTTSRQLKWWLDEFGSLVKGLTKKTLEIMYNEHLAYNRETGELTPLTKEEEREIAHIRHEAFNYGYGW